MVTVSRSIVTSALEAASGPVPGFPSGSTAAPGPRLAAIRSRPRATTSHRPSSS